jgi:hypothetical protein
MQRYFLSVQTLFHPFPITADFSSFLGMACCSTSRCDRDGCLDLNRVTVVTVVILVVLAMVISDIF